MFSSHPEDRTLQSTTPETKKEVPRLGGSGGGGDWEGGGVGGGNGEGGSGVEGMGKEGVKRMGREWGVGDDGEWEWEGLGREGGWVAVGRCRGGEGVWEGREWGREKRRRRKYWRLMRKVTVRIWSQTPNPSISSIVT